MEIRNLLVEQDPIPKEGCEGMQGENFPDINSNVDLVVLFRRTSSIEQFASSGS